MVEGDIGSPTWKFTQYVLSPTIPLFDFGVSQSRWAIVRRLRSVVFVDADAPARHSGRTWISNQCGLLTRSYRCFGDKGDVEDITEGKFEAVLDCDVSPTFLSHGFCGRSAPVF
jgi:hypothetical protein